MAGPTAARSEERQGTWSRRFLGDTSLPFHERVHRTSSSTLFRFRVQTSAYVMGFMAVLSGLNLTVWREDGFWGSALPVFLLAFCVTWLTAMVVSYANAADGDRGRDR